MGQRRNTFKLTCFHIEDIFAFTGGLGNSYIKDFVDDEFGIDILERIGNPETLLLRMTKDNSLVGNVAASQRNYRGDQKTYDENSMGKIYNEIVGTVPYSEELEEIKKLIFNSDEEAKINIKAKASLSFSRAISFADLKKLITFIKNVPDENKFQFSKIRKLSGRRKSMRILTEIRN